MKRKAKLLDTEKTFFSLVMNAVQANPFSEERLKTDLQIAGLFEGTPRDVVFEKTIKEVKRQIAVLTKEGRANLSCYREPDKTIIKATYLFDFFHHYCNKFDQLIIDQIESHNAKKRDPLIVTFAKEALSTLRQWGFTIEESLHYFSLSFQLRRAFFFIGQELVGRSECMINFREKLWNNVFTSDLEFYNQHLWSKMEDFSTLILGETGTGKGTAANAIGRSGYIPFDEKTMKFKESFTQSFVGLNISQFPENLIESELFGHKKGSFTSAVDDHKGVFSRCSPYGSIFLDEIGEVSVPVQIKLLKVLEEREFSPVGSRGVHRFKGRIITATNRSHTELQNPTILRKDFYYRLCSDIIIVPPLRQRIKEDPNELDDLIKHRVKKIIDSVSNTTLTILKKRLNNHLGPHYHWPGNVRELEQYIRRVLLNRNGEIIKEEQSRAITNDNSNPQSLAGKMALGEMTAKDVLKAYCFNLFELYGNLGEVARRTQLDRRTVKKYRDEWSKHTDSL